MGLRVLPEHADFLTEKRFRWKSASAAGGCSPAGSKWQMMAGSTSAAHGARMNRGKTARLSLSGETEPWLIFRARPDRRRYDARAAGRRRPHDQRRSRN